MPMSDARAAGELPLAHGYAWGEDAPMYDDTQPQDEATARLIERAYGLYDEFLREVDYCHRRIRDCREIYELRDPYAGDHEPQLPTLLSTIQSKIADQMDNMPEAMLAPESPGMQQYAEDATDLVRWVFERNDIDSLYQQLCEDMYVSGMAVMQIQWDEDMDAGQGNIRLTRCPAEMLVWDPTAEELQESRAIFRTAFQSREWYIAHYPDAGKYVRPDEYENLYRPRATGQEDDIMLLEMWWREYDAAASRYRIHMAQMAGRVMLYDSRHEHPMGIYAHGKYPFAACVYRASTKSLAGRSCIEDYVELNRYANRNAKYIDWATRMAARPKLMIPKTIELENPDALTDADSQVVRYLGMGGDIRGSVSWMPAPQVPSMAFSMQQWYIDSIKQESGQNQFARGEGGLGVTAASAIQSLQEAGAKSSRMEAQRLSGMYRAACDQVLWLLAQFFDPPRVIMITGREDSPFAATPMVVGRMQLVADDQIAPAYRVNLQIRRRNPLRVEAENQMILQMYQMSQQSQTPMSLDMVLQLLQFDGKDRIAPQVRALEKEQRLTAQAINVAQQASEDAQAKTEQLNGMRDGLIQEAMAVLADEPEESVYG